MFLCIVSCFVHAYDRTLVNINSLIQCLVSINLSSDDLIENVYYMLIPMQHIYVLIIYNSLYINFKELRQRVVNFPSKSSSHHRLFDSLEM